MSRSSNSAGNHTSLIQFSLCSLGRSPSGQGPAPGWTSGCSPCVSWSTSRWPIPCWWSTRLSTVLTISPMRWGSRDLRAANKPFLFFLLICILLSGLFGGFLHSFSFVNRQGALNINERTIPQPRLLQLSVEKLSREGAFLMDAGTVGCFQCCYHL